jgi:hypothetical protein
MIPRWLAIATCLAGQATAQTRGEDVSRIDLVPGWQAPDGRHMAGLGIVLDPGWYTYWREPGDSGVPPVFDWTGSENLAALGVEFPEPGVIESYGQTAFGYHGGVVLPLAVTPADPARPVRLRLSMMYGVCRDVCVPATGQADLLLEPGGAAADAAAEAIRKAMAAMPVDAAEGGVRTVRCVIAPDGGSWRLNARIGFSGPPQAVTAAIIEGGSDLIWIGRAEISLDGSDLDLAAPVEYFGDGTFSPDMGLVRLTLLGPDRAVDIRGCPEG